MARITKETNLLVVGGDAEGSSGAISSKQQKAAKAGVEIWTEEQWMVSLRNAGAP